MVWAWPLPKLRSLRIFGNDVVVVVVVIVVVSHRDRRIQSANYVKSDLLRSLHTHATYRSPPPSLCVSLSSLTARAKSAKASQQQRLSNDDDPIPYSIFRMASRCRRLLYEMPGISISIS